MNEYLRQEHCLEHYHVAYPEVAGQARFPIVVERLHVQIDRLLRSDLAYYSFDNTDYRQDKLYDLGTHLHIHCTFAVPCFLWLSHQSSPVGHNFDSAAAAVLVVVVVGVALAVVLDDAAASGPDSVSGCTVGFFCFVSGADLAEH